MKNLKISTIPLHDSMKVVLKGELILMDALLAKVQLKELAANNCKIQIDLNQVTKIDLTGLNAIISAKVNMGLNGNGILLEANECHPIFELLHLTKLTNQFNYEYNNQLSHEV